MGVPTWMYRQVDGKTVGKIFDSEDIPAGWSDNCYAVNEAPENEIIEIDNKDDLEQYAKERFGVDIDKRKKLSTLLKEVRGLVSNS